ncbi:hypothetical protein [Bacillus sp. RO1]|uniref:hypothetical protein n=1 Tax=Bacillus sp. RO1 TaxID=2722703 RepID=UPI001456DCA7|nr:hypothetical protein [Bacillus sp. RO1]NLP52753.1 hypothetical protein [Bacillus sp. RO1]
MHLLRIVSLFVIFLMAFLINLDHSTPNSILAIYEKSFYLEFENAPLVENPDDEGIIGIVCNSDFYKNNFISLIQEQTGVKLTFHLVTVFYQGSYI